MNFDNLTHYSVLLNESIEGLNIKEDGIYVDGTLGGAGHSKKILETLSSNKNSSILATSPVFKIQSISLAV